MSSDTYSAVVTVVACPCEVFFVPTSSSRTRHGLLAVIAQWTCSVSSFAITGLRAVQGLVN